MVDRDLAQIYGLPTKAFNQAVKRNRQLFPKDLTFRLTQEEAKALRASRSQTVISNQRGGPRYLLHAFTGYGALMAANIRLDVHEAAIVHANLESTAGARTATTQNWFSPALGPQPPIPIPRSSFQLFVGLALRSCVDSILNRAPEPSLLFLFLLSWPFHRFLLLSR